MSEWEQALEIITLPFHLKSKECVDVLIQKLLKQYVGIYDIEISKYMLMSKYIDKKPY